MSSSITVISGLYTQHYRGGKTDFYVHSPGFLANTVKKSIELGIKPDEVKWLSINQGLHYDDPHSDEQVAVQEVKNGGHLLIDANSLPAVAKRINDSPELLDASARARVHFWQYNIGNLRNLNPTPPYEGEWINDYGDYAQLVIGRELLDRVPYM